MKDIAPTLGTGVSSLPPEGAQTALGRPGGGLTMTPDQVLRHLRRANEVARRAMALGRHPFGAILVAPDGETVLAEQGNVDTVNHAESVLARTAATNFTPNISRSAPWSPPWSPAPCAPARSIGPTSADWSMA